ncbi:unnamed protein product [Effrenium voratum]|uniref:Uncharacterized protein n=1 Tax=Effrenium voratum TaxID=2562239 RepID=A0AA36HTR1_9DINO|nr:unnamed protein product [Effrenium voratum]CAJ1414507.1 unnamed protein product [Effrenium voratum]
MSEGDARWHWPRYAACWAKADLAISSADFRATYAVSVSQSQLQIACYDGCQPNAAQDSRWTDISGLPQPAKKSKDTLGLSFGVAPRPIGMALVSLEAAECLLILLSSGHLLAASLQNLGVESVLATFPEVSDGHAAGAAIAVVQPLAWAVVAAGPKLGLVELEGAANSGVKAFELPKGFAASMVMAYPQEESALLVGCSTGQLLLYSCTVIHKGQVQRLNLSLVQLLEISGAVVQNGPAAGFRATVGRLLGRDRSQTPPRTGSKPRGAGDISVGDAFALPSADGDGLLVACAGSGTGGPGSLLSVWHTSRDTVKDSQSATSRSRSGPMPALGCSHFALTTSPTRILRVVAIAGSRAGGTGHVILALDSFSDLTIWSARQKALTPLRVIPGRCPFEIASARTFALSGSLYLLVGTGSRSTAEVAWLDVAAVLESGGCSADLMPPFAGRTRSRDLPPAFTGDATQPAGGDIFFVSGSACRCYKASNGRTLALPLPEADQPLGILDVLRLPSSITQLLLAVSQADGTNAVWLVNAEGELIARIMAVDACFTSSRIVWLCREGSMRTCHATLPSAPCGVLQPAASATAEGVERVIGHADSDLVLFWGSRLDGGPLRFEAGGAVASIPSCGPMELVDFRWDGQPLQLAGSCLALAAPFAVWVVLLDGGRAQLLAWLDVRAAYAGGGRLLSISWLKARDLESSGVLLLSTPFGVSAWAAKPLCRPRVLALHERPQLVTAALADRLIMVELQAGTCLHDGPDNIGTFPSASLVSPRLKARIRTRPISFFEVLCQLCPGQDGPWIKEVDWRLAPAELSQELPQSIASQLWPATSCSEAPPQLRESPSALGAIAKAAREEFRALAAIANGLSSSRGRQEDSAALTVRLVGQIEDGLHTLRSSPARMQMLSCAAELIVICCKSSTPGANVEALAITSNVLAKQDVLPLGSLMSCIQVSYPLCSCPLLMFGKGILEVSSSSFHWSDAVCSCAPLAEALLREALQQRPLERTTPDLSAAALWQQPFSETPPLRKSQACQLHTATLMQWLGLGTTQVQVRVFKAIQHEAEESPSSHEESPGHAEREPGVLANGLLIYWRCADGEGAHVRDSAGCGRAGALRGGNWRGPLLPDDPMESTDEWGQALSPNFAIHLGQAELRYSPTSTSDREMLALVAGSRPDGEQHLSKARDENEGDMLVAGWTVELWLRRVKRSPEDAILFQRSGSSTLEWRYKPSQPGFEVNISGRTALAGSCDALPEAEWVHVALRSNIASLEVWVDGLMTLTASGNMPPLPLEADVTFGPAELEITEVRVWGVCRAESDLQHFQHQCLDTLLGSELRGEAWRKVKIRAAADVPAPTGEGNLSRLWGISALSHPGTGRRRADTSQASMSAAENDAASEDPQDAWPSWSGGVTAGFGDWPPEIEVQPVPAPTAPGTSAEWPADEGQGEAATAEEVHEKPKSPLPPPREEPPPPKTSFAPIGRLMQGILAKRQAEADRPASKATPMDTHEAPQAFLPPGPTVAKSLQTPTSGFGGLVEPSKHDSVPKLQPRRVPALKQAPPLLEVLPPLPVECGALAGTDASVGIAANAFDRQAFGFANAVFTSVISQLVGAGISPTTPAVRSRLEAAVSYSCVCRLLEGIQEQQAAILKANGEASSAHFQRQLCQRWDCLLRLSKSPHHTVQLSLRAMASLFHFAESAGGWAAARQIAEVLSSRYSMYLDSEQQHQVQHVLETADCGQLAGRSSAPMVHDCPNCRAPLDALMRVCDSCNALLAVDFRELRLIDLRRGCQCSLCAATFGGGNVPHYPKLERRRVAGLPQSVRSQNCPACGSGELSMGAPTLAY